MNWFLKNISIALVLCLGVVACGRSATHKVDDPNHVAAQFSITADPKPLPKLRDEPQIMRLSEPCTVMDGWRLGLQDAQTAGYVPWGEESSILTEAAYAARRNDDKKIIFCKGVLQLIKDNYPDMFWQIVLRTQGDSSLRVSIEDFEDAAEWHEQQAAVKAAQKQPQTQPAQ